MSQWKDALCLLAVLVAYGLAGHLDYQDAVAMEEAMRDVAAVPCTAADDAAEAFKRLPPPAEMQVRRARPAPSSAINAACWPAQP